MEPVAAPLVTEGSLALRYLVGMVGECVIYSTAVDIKILAEMLSCNAGALDMPTGITKAEGGLPLKLLIVELGLGKPKNEVCLISLVSVLLYSVAHANGKLVLGKVVKHIVLLQL